CILFVTRGDKANLTRWKRQEQLKVEDLRSIYRELTRQVPAGEAGFVNLDLLGSSDGATDAKALDPTAVRVGASLLERVGLIVRHADAPRFAIVTLTPEGEKSRDPEFMRFRAEARLFGGEPARRDVGVLARELGVLPPALERAMLGWQDRGWIEYR